MSDYYRTRLAAERLSSCYELAPIRVKQYLRAEVEFAAGLVRRNDHIIELGCGYGRLLFELAGVAVYAVGIDTSIASLELAQAASRRKSNCELAVSDAVRTGFADRSFDKVFCLQNGISAFHVDRRDLISEAVRLTRPGGKAVFSTYCDSFWEHRLRWFELQADAGLVGEIDRDRTCDGVIVCEGGFTATTVGPDRFRELTEGLSVRTEIVEVDQSSLFCICSLPE
ncbi:MAG: class I SAM-dependent methyltransferase [Candidatus Zixiibacteriota bacterium]